MRIETFLLLIALGGCIGTDYLNDPIIPEKIVLAPSQLALKPNQTFQLTASYFDKYGLPKEVAPTWFSLLPSVAVVDQRGLVTAIGGGQTQIVATFGTAESNAINVTVVLNNTQVAKVEATSPGGKNSLTVSEMITLTASVTNINNEVITGKTIEWFSENSSIAQVNNQGVVTGISAGVVDIHAKVEGIKSNVVSFSIGGGRTGTFVGAGGYKTSGNGSLLIQGGKLYLELAANFETSFALGTYVYLANSTNSSNVKVSGLEVGQITTNGMKTFNLTDLKPGIGLYDYKYIIILCKPATVTFGYAELK